MNQWLVNQFAKSSNQKIFFAAILAVSIWSVIWKGVALWKSARNKQKYWFIAILVLNTIGIVEIVYLLLFQSTGRLNIVELHSRKGRKKKDHKK